MLNYRLNGPRRLGRPLKILLEEAETGLLRYNSLRMIMLNYFGLRVQFVLFLWEMYTYILLITRNLLDTFEREVFHPEVFVK